MTLPCLIRFFGNCNSGCVTTAESMLIEQQSYQKLLDVLIENQATTSKRRLVVLSISPQSLASLSDLLSMSLADTFLKVSFLLKVSRFIIPVAYMC